MLLSSLPLAACLSAALHASARMASHSGRDGSPDAAAKRYVVLDTTSDSPSWTAVLMAMEATADPTNDFTLLGILATESPELDSFNHLMQTAGLSECVTVISSNEQDLYPVDGYTMQDAPKTVRQLVQWVDAYPDQITVYASSSLATLAFATAVDPDLASEIKELVIVANLDDSSDFNRSGLVGFYENTPFIRDQDAFLATMSSRIPLFRIMGPLQPTLSGPEIAERVREAITSEAASPEDEKAMLAARPFAAAYLAGHKARLMAGHQKAILMQEPAMAVLVDPRLATGETDVEFTFEQSEQDPNQPPMLMLRKLAEDKTDPDDRATVIYAFDEDRFWDLLVHTRSRDWSGFCKSQKDESVLGNMHDEL